jgi:hypothetical protein
MRRSAVTKHSRSRKDYASGLPDHHDPTAGIGGAPPAFSALTLRLWLAGFGLLFCTGAAILAARAGLTALAAVLALLAAVAAIDLAWVARRKRRGEPG